MSFCLYICICSECVPSVLGGQKRELDSLSLELQTVVRSHVGVENQTWSFGRAASALNH